MKRIPYGSDTRSNLLGSQGQNTLGVRLKGTALTKNRNNRNLDPSDSEILNIMTKKLKVDKKMIKRQTTILNPESPSLKKLSLVKEPASKDEKYKAPAVSEMISMGKTSTEGIDKDDGNSLFGFRKKSPVAKYK